MRGFSLLLAVLLFSCGDQAKNSPQKTEVKTVGCTKAPVLTVNPAPAPAPQEFVVSRPAALQIKAGISGKLAVRSPVLHEGEAVRKGQLIVQLDNTELFLKLRGKKKALREALESIKPQVAGADSAAFSAFARRLNPNALLPPFPKLSLPTLQLLHAHHLLDRYDEIAAEEAGMKNYFILAPADGRICSLHLADELQAGSILMTIVPEELILSPAVPGRKGTTITLRNASGSVVSAAIRSQSATATRITGRLQPGKYYRIVQ